MAVVQLKQAVRQGRGITWLTAPNERVLVTPGSSTYMVDQDSLVTSMITRASSARARARRSDVQAEASCGRPSRSRMLDLKSKAVKSKGGFPSEMVEFNIGLLAKLGHLCHLLSTNAIYNSWVGHVPSGLALPNVITWESSMVIGHTGWSRSDWARE